jgi:Rrf2 family protein
MLSNACQYAIRSILFLAMYSDEKNKIGVKKVSEELETPLPFLAKLLQQLAKSNLVSSIKGPNGGFYLTKHNKKNSIWDIIVCIDGSSKFEGCFMGLSSCNEEAPCPVHYNVAQFKDKLLEDFQSKSIGQFALEIQKKGRVITLKEFNAINRD